MDCPDCQKPLTEPKMLGNIAAISLWVVLEVSAIALAIFFAIIFTISETSAYAYVFVGLCILLMVMAPRLKLYKCNICNQRFSHVQGKKKT